MLVVASKILAVAVNKRQAVAQVDVSTASIS